MPYPTHGVEPLTTEPPAAALVSKPVALAHSTLVSMSQPLVTSLMPFVGPLLVVAVLPSLQIPCRSRALLL